MLTQKLLLIATLAIPATTLAGETPTKDDSKKDAEEIIEGLAEDAAKAAKEKADADAPPPPPEPDVPEVTADDFFTFTDFVDSRVTFALSNVNLLAGPGERLTQTSGYRIGVDPGFNLFLENINTRFSGYESLSHLVLYKKTPAFFTNVETEAALAALVLADTNTGKLNLFDSGTYLRVIKKFGAGDENDVGAIDLTAWPVSADRFRLGYTYLISWGGTSIFPGKLQSSSITEGAVPGLRLRWRAPKGNAYGFIGLKSALLLSRDAGKEAGEQVPNYGLLLGGGVDIGKRFVIEANGGLFQKGTQERQSLEGEGILAFGASARISLYDGIPPPQSADLKLYRNDPRYPVDYNVFKPWKVGRGYSVGLEGSTLFQNLEDPDFYGSEKLVTALSAGLVGGIQLDYLRINLSAFFQSADFILFNVPGFVPFQATPAASTTTPEFFASVGAEYFVESLHFQPSVAVGFKMPATYKGGVLADQGASVGGAEPGDTRTQIIVDETTRLILPPDVDATPIIGAMLKLPFFLSPTMVVSAEARFEINDNQVRLAGDNERGEVTYLFDDPFRLSLGLVLQSRF